MARYHFDYHEAELVTVDRAGEEFESIDAARKMATIALGEAVRDFTFAGRPGRIAILVRDDTGPVLSVSATIEQT
jgi:hypothetical protein